MYAKCFRPNKISRKVVKNNFRIFGGEKMVAIDKMLEEKSKNILVEHHETKGDRIKPA